MAGRLAVSMLQQGLQPVRMGLLKRALPASSLALPTSSCSRAFSAQAATEAPAKIPDSELMNHFRLRTKRRWVDFAPYVVNIKFSFDPSLDGTTGCKEFWRQCRGTSIRKQFPKYTVDLEINSRGLPAQVAVKYNDGKGHTVSAQGKNVQDIMDDMASFIAPMQEKEDMDALEKN